MTLYGKENALTINPVKVIDNLMKAKYGFKKDYISVIKNGYIFIEIIPLDKDASGQVISIL